jgi:hypothetical protein
LEPSEVDFFRLASELAARIRSAAFVADDRWCSELFLPSGFFDKKSIERGLIPLSSCAVTEPGELARIDDHCLNGMPSRLLLRELLIREIEPFIIGIGEVRVTTKDAFDGLVVFAVKVRDQTFNHAASAFSCAT